MEVNRTTLETIFADIVNSVGFKTTVGPVDKSKVTKRLAGTATPLPSARLAKAAWRVAALLTPLTPPPPPTYIKVAPITVTQQGGSDQRVCLFEGGVEGGPLRPGVRRITEGEHAGKYTDEHPGGTVYESNGLENTSVRTKLEEGAFGLTKAREMDGRNACQCHTAGDPTKNTGSWTV